MLLFNRFDIDSNLITPYNSVDYLPKLEYYIIGCKNEFLNIPFIKNISEQIFCGRKYHEKINSEDSDNIKSYYIEFDKNHWNILNSTLLCNAIVNIIEK